MAAEWNFVIEEDEDDEFQVEKSDSSRECKIFIVDGSESMIKDSVKTGSSKDEPYFLLSMKAIRETMCRQCVSGDKDFIGIVIINTKKTDNSHSFNHISCLQDIGIPGAERVKEIEEFCEAENIEDVYKRKFEGYEQCKWDEALWLAGSMLSNSTVKFGTKRIFILTDCDQPCSPGEKDTSKRILQKWKDLRDQDITINLIPLSADFEGEKFWNYLDDKNYNKEGYGTTIQELLEDVRRKEYKKRATGNIPFNLGEGVEFSVGIFNNVAPARIPNAVHLDRKKNEEVLTRTSYFNTETGEKLLDRDMQKYQVYGGKKIAMEFDEVESLRRLTPAGLVLLGFKPISCLKLHHHFRPAVFLYPDEKQIRGSTKIFRALLDRCLAREVMPICRLTARRNMPPRLVALLPQKYDPEIPDSDPPGFTAVFLPFAEDLRDLSKVMKEERTTASVDQVERAKAVIRKLPIENYKAHMFENPVLAKHYRALEAMALEKTEWENCVTDMTKPDMERINRRAGKELEQFRDSVFPPDYNPNRKGASSGGTAAKKAKGNETELVDLETEAKAGRLGKLTVASLKEHCALAGIRLKSQRKADIIEKITQHFAL